MSHHHKISTGPAITDRPTSAGEWHWRPNTPPEDTPDNQALRWWRTALVAWWAYPNYFVRVLVTETPGAGRLCRELNMGGSIHCGEEISMKYYECKNVRFSVSSTKGPIPDNSPLIAMAMMRAAIKLYHDLTEEERDTMVVREITPEMTLDCRQFAFYADPEIPDDMRGLWKPKLDEVVRGENSKFDERGELRLTR